MACDLDWQAIATFATGILAVCAAIYIGRKQTIIQHRQTILIENDLKVQLLERRSACVSAMRKIFYAWQANVRLEHQQWRDFYSLMDDVELLFPKEVYHDISKAVDGTLWSKRHYDLALLFHKDGKTDEAQKRVQQSQEQENRVHDVMPRLLEAMIRHTRIDAWE